jgi:ComF family protein
MAPEPDRTKPNGLNLTPCARNLKVTAMPGLTAIGRGVRQLSALALNSVLPPRCLACGSTVEKPGALCSPCWQAIDFLAPPHCALCGLPFEFDVGPSALCGACVREPPAYDRARAVMRYDDHSRGLILGFKYTDRTEGAPAYGAWLIRAGQELLAGTELIVPVPLHWRRLFGRRYNQSALLAQALSRQTRVPVALDALRRHRHTVSQGRLSASERQRNVAGAFAVPAAKQALVRDRRVLLVDDVMTTGSTVSACAKSLRRAGAVAVDVLVLARVIRPEA